MKKIILSVLCAIALILPMALIYKTAVKDIPPQYGDSFLGEMTEKQQRLKELEEKSRIVLVGGSNLAFGIDSELLEFYTKRPVVNYGLYAALGTKAMLDFSENHIKDGDIIIICPETNEQTYSLYYNGEAVWQALDADMSLLRDVGSSNYPKLISTLIGYAGAKNEFYTTKTTPKPEGIYARASFDDYGDIFVDRPYNEMPKMYDESQPISISKDIISDDFIDYVNSYAKKAKEKGAKVYFSFSPMNSLAITSTEEEKEEFYRYLGENLDIEIISDIEPYIMDAGYFYDTNFHMNTVGSAYRTAVLADDIVRIYGKTFADSTDKPAPPKRPVDLFAVVTEDDDTGFFEYSEDGGELVLCGLTEEGKKQTELSIPLSFESKPIAVIGEKAFSGAKKLRRIVIPETSNLRLIGKRAFSGCDSLREISVNVGPDKLSADAEAFSGMSGSCFMYVNEKLFAEYSTDYFWGGRMAYIRKK